jgi:pimeloyl-ACP methyl ester carboxylesterase
MNRLPIIYIRGYAGPTAGIDSQVDDPFYGFNLGATHVRVGGDGEPAFYQFEGPMLRLMSDENYRLLVRGDQQRYLDDADNGTVPSASLWVYRFYDQAATTFVPPVRREGTLERFFTKLHQKVTADGFDIEKAAAGLYTLIQDVRAKTGAEKVNLVAHSMGGLVVRCMIQKLCGEDGREPSAAIVDKFFTYGTPHGGISFDFGVLDWAEQAFGPAGADIFAPEKMYGYLTPGKTFGKDLPQDGDEWDPQTINKETFDPANIFCLVGTDPKDYGLSRVVVGPKSDGLVRIEHAYVRNAHRAYVYKSHSGSYGEVNSEEGYQNLRRFLFGRWGVSVDFAGLPRLAAEPADQEGNPPAGPVWQADMRLAIRGLSVVMSEQQAQHWCPIQLTDELRRRVDTADSPVPLLTTFMIDPAHDVEVAAERHEPPRPAAHGGRMRYVLSLRVYQLYEHGGSFDFSDHLEQVPDWADSLIIDVGPNHNNTGLAAWAAWNSAVPGAIKDFEIITEALPLDAQRAITLTVRDGMHLGSIPMPDAARSLPVLGPEAKLALAVTDRETATAAPQPG